MNPTASMTESQISDNIELGGAGGNATGSGHAAGNGGGAFGAMSMNTFGATTIAKSTISDNTPRWEAVPGRPRTERLDPREETPAVQDWRQTGR